MLVATTLYAARAARNFDLNMAAFMSTNATQQNWGRSYLVEDCYRRVIPRDAPEKHYVNVSF